MTALLRSLFVVSALCAAIFAPRVLAQGTIPGQRVVPLGYCQMTSLGTATAITAANCVRASFTATGSGANLTVSSVTGTIRPGDALAGTGVVAGTRVISQTNGVTGGAGVYVTSRATTSAAASLTAGGAPQSATAATIEAEAQIVRYRDDGVAPTASVGVPIAAGASILYSGPLDVIQFIEATSTAKVNILFYRTP